MSPAKRLQKTDISPASTHFARLKRIHYLNNSRAFAVEDHRAECPDSEAALRFSAAPAGAAPRDPLWGSVWGCILGERCFWERGVNF
jgi:hypothetical protein